MLGASASRVGPAVRFAPLGALLATVAIYSAVHEEAEAPALATCVDGTTHEKLICDDPIKVSKCFDAKVTCSKWDVEDCCSSVPLHKCLSPFATRYFGPDCSSPIDAREECCGDPVTHKRAFQAIADLQASVESGVESAEKLASQALEDAGLSDELAAATQALADAADAVSSQATAGIEAATAATAAAANATMLAVTGLEEKLVSATGDEKEVLKTQVAKLQAQTAALKAQLAEVAAAEAAAS